MSKMLNFAMFIFGAAVGAVVAYRFAKAKYEHIAQEEIESVKKVYHGKESKSENNEDEKTEVAEYTEMLKNSGYTNYSKNEKRSRNQWKVNLMSFLRTNLASSTNMKQ